MTDGIRSNIEEWTGVRPTTCPWQAYSYPLVHRVLHAFDFYDKGELSIYEPDASNRLLEGLSLYARASAKVHAKRMRMDREKAERERQARRRHG